MELALVLAQYHRELMDFKTIAESMYPFWMIGTIVIAMVLAAGKKNVLRIERKPVLVWGACMVLLVGWRIFLDKVIGYHGSQMAVQGMLTIPWTASFTVFWEDACHGLPLLLLQDLIGKKKRWAKVLYGVVLTTIMVAFGLGHLYQGIFPALLLCMYIPYSVDVGRRYGFGTIIICHMLYDLSTLLFVHYLVGL